MSTLRPYGVIIEASVCGEKVKTLLLCHTVDVTVVCVCVCGCHFFIKTLITFSNLFFFYCTLSDYHGSYGLFPAFTNLAVVADYL